jgi:hypothetical protein
LQSPLIQTSIIQASIASMQQPHQQASIASIQQPNQNHISTTKFQGMRRFFSSLFRQKNSVVPAINNKDEKESTNDELSCIVCFDAIIDTMLSPCNHLQVCHNCAQLLLVCPSCRLPIVTRIKVFAPFN